MLRRCGSPTKRWGATIKIGSNGVTAKVHRLPSSPTSSAKATDEVKKSNILGLGLMTLPIRTRPAEPMALTNRVSHGKGEKALPARKSSGEVLKTVPTRICKSRKSKDAAIAKLVATPSPKTKEIRKSIKKDDSDAKVKAQVGASPSNTTKIKAEPEDSEVSDGSYLSDFEPEDILSTKVRNGRRKYLVKWRGKPASEYSWHPMEHLYYSQGLIKEFHATRGDKP